MVISIPGIINTIARPTPHGQYLLSWTAGITMLYLDLDNMDRSIDYRKLYCVWINLRLSLAKANPFPGLYLTMQT